MIARDLAEGRVVQLFDVNVDVAPPPITSCIRSTRRTIRASSHCATGSRMKSRRCTRSGDGGACYRARISTARRPIPGRVLSCPHLHRATPDSGHVPPMSQPENDLILLSTMQPELHPGAFAFVSLPTDADVSLSGSHCNVPRSGGADGRGRRGDGGASWLARAVPLGLDHADRAFRPPGCRPHGGVRTRARRGRHQLQRDGGCLPRSHLRAVRRWPARTRRARRAPARRDARERSNAAATRKNGRNGPRTERIAPEHDPAHGFTCSRHPRTTRRASCARRRSCA